MVPLIVALLLALPLTGQGCPHEGSDHRLLGHLGCPVQRKLTIEGARPLNRLALTFWILQPCLLGLFLCRERFRQRSEFTTNIFEKQPSLDDFGLENL